MINKIAIKGFTGFAMLLGFCLVTSAYAEQGGRFYIGGQIGGGSSGWGSLQDAVRHRGSYDNVTATDTGFTGRISGGYIFNKNIDIGIGFANSFKKTLLTSDNFSEQDVQISTKSCDLSLGLIVPFGDTGFELYSRTGVGCLISNGLPTNTTRSYSIVKYVKSNLMNYGLMYEFGASFIISDHVGLSLSYSHTDGNQSLAKNSNEAYTNFQPSFKNIFFGVKYMF